MPEEVLVYDLDTNKAHCLNETAAFVWKSCDGVNSVADITKLFGKQTGTPAPENLIWLAIDQLNARNLLTEKLKVNFNGQTRREAVKKIGLAAVVALPIISSLVAPTAAWAVACSAGVVSCQTPGGACNQGTPCTCSGAGSGQCNGLGQCTAGGTGVTPC